MRHHPAHPRHLKMASIGYRITSIDRIMQYVLEMRHNRFSLHEWHISRMVSMLSNSSISKMMSISSSVHSVMMMIKIWVCDHLYRHDLFLSCICSHMMDSRGYILGENSSNSEIEIVMVSLVRLIMRSFIRCKSSS